MNYIKNMSLLAIAIILSCFQLQAQEIHGVIIEDIADEEIMAPSALVEVSPIRAKLMVRNDGALMVDVREVDEVKVIAYDVEKLINIPLSVIQDRLSEIPRDQKLIIACRSGNRSKKAIAILMANGYTNLVNLEGGIKAWESKNLDVIKAGTPTVKKACCTNPNDKKCKPDGTCKKPEAKVKAKACCSKGSKDSKKCATKKVTKDN